MDLKWLEDFLTLAETRNFSQSAEIRGVTQSAFSRRIRSLENWLGAELLNRDGYPITLTAEGRLFHETAGEVVRMIHARRTEFRQHTPDGGPVIALTALHSLTITFLPHWLTRLREVIGPVASRVKPENFIRCIEALTDGGYDFFLTFHHPRVRFPLPPDAFPHLVIGQDSLAAVARPARVEAWAREGKAMPLVQYSRGSFLGALAAVAQAQEGAPQFYVAHTNETSMAEAMKSMAVEGHGIVWLPRSLIANEVAAGQLEVVAPELPMEIRLYRNAARVRALTKQVWKAAGRLAQGYANPE